jgi:hypothetical protein
VTAPTKKDAFTGLVFVGAGAASIVLLAGAVALSQDLLGVDEFSGIMEGVVSVFAVVAGGSLAAYKYRSKGPS